MKVFYDVHIHTCLSPCADENMTPNNIINMAKLNGLDIIAVTDHNSCKNCRAVYEVGKKAGICVIGGMELCTSEDIHVVCLFPSIEKTELFAEYVYKKINVVKNKEEVFGTQFIVDMNDNIIKKEENLLVSAAMINIFDVNNLVNKYDGVAIPAHIDRNAYSIISVMGEIGKDTTFNCLEIYNINKLTQLQDKHEVLKNKVIISNSDAHNLEGMCRNKQSIEIDNISAENFIGKLKGR